MKPLEIDQSAGVILSGELGSINNGKTGINMPTANRSIKIVENTAINGYLDSFDLTGCDQIFSV